MKTTLFNPSSFARLGACVVATLGLGIASAVAVPSVTLLVGGQDFGPGNTMKATSKALLSPSVAYEFSVEGTCVGTGGLKKLVKPGTPISVFFNKLTLSGTYDNPSGKLPITIFNKTYKATQTINGVPVTISAKVKGGTEANGKVYFEVTNVKVTSPAPLPDGTIRFEPGAKVVISAVPVVQFKTISKNVSESGGTVEVEISKIGKGACSVTLTSADLNANNTHYTPVSQTVSFGTSLTKVVVPVTILPNTVKDGYRKFTLTLSSPTNGAVLGTKKVQTIGILDDD
jgi:Calx-beta domain